MISSKTMRNVVVMSFLVFPMAACSESDVDKLAKIYVKKGEGSLSKPVATCIAKAILNSDELSDETKKLLIAGETAPTVAEEFTIAGIGMGQMGNTDC